jgi:hypothetical protein
LRNAFDPPGMLLRPFPFDRACIDGRKTWNADYSFVPEGENCRLEADGWAPYKGEWRVGACICYCAAVAWGSTEISTLEG